MKLKILITTLALVSSTMLFADNYSTTITFDGGPTCEVNIDYKISINPSDPLPFEINSLTSTDQNCSKYISNNKGSAVNKALKILETEKPFPKPHY